MKKICFALLASALLTVGCKKGNETIQSQPEAKPVAAFKISNLTSTGKILEGNFTDFDNKSTNGNTYKWDFGNGITSTDARPTNIYFVPCGHNYQISLTVTNKSGVSDTYSETFEVMCRGKNAHNTPPVHIPTVEIQQYINDHE